MDPGVPQQNGRHERFHLTLLEAMRPPAADRAEQQQRFDAFQADYNSERPHQALGQKPPASLYRASLRSGRVAGPLLRRAARHHRPDPPKTPPPQTTKTPDRRRPGPFQSRRSVTHPSGQFCYSSIRWTGSGMRGGEAGQRRRMLRGLGRRAASAPPHRPAGHFSPLGRRYPRRGRPVPATAMKAISTIRSIRLFALLPFIPMKLPDCIRPWQVHKSGMG
nr:integrase core domain-containing protein [Aureimonas glaciei]